MTSILKLEELHSKTGHQAIVVDNAGAVTFPNSGAFGSLLQYRTASTGFVSQTISSSTKQPVNGMVMDFTPLEATSQIIIGGYIAASWSYVAGMGVFMDGTALHGDGGGSLQTGGDELWTTHDGQSNGTNRMYPFPFMYAHTAGSTATRTYQIYANAGWNGATTALYINDRGSSDMLSQSWMYVMEVVS